MPRFFMCVSVSVYAYDSRTTLLHRVRRVSTESILSRIGMDIGFERFIGRLIEPVHVFDVAHGFVIEQIELTMFREALFLKTNANAEQAHRLAAPREAFFE